MSRFNEVEYDAEAGTATVGAGLIWDDVYAALAPHGVNVIGGRVSGVGVAGFTLGGGSFPRCTLGETRLIESHDVCRVLVEDEPIWVDSG